MFHLSLLAVLAISSASVSAVKASINNTVEHGVNTECKTCPYTLCTNKVYYESDALVTVTCYTHGTVIDGDEYIFSSVLFENSSTKTICYSVWLQTTDGCYVTQYDLTDYVGDCKFCRTTIPHHGAVPF
jgi:hypothetical protein